MMKYYVNYAKAFKYFIMFGYGFNPMSIEENIEYHILDKEHVICALKKAFFDMSPRTIKTNVDTLEILQSRNDFFEEIALKYISYFRGENIDFEKWHEEVCEYILKELKYLYQNEDIKFGKAQKIVNMTFKYLYCFDDAKDYLEKFKCCHMALDSYTLNWFISWYQDEFNKLHKKSGVKLSLSGNNHICKWSNLEKESPESCIIPHYKEIQTAIKNRFIGKELTPFEAEFLIWFKTKQINEALYSRNMINSIKENNYFGF